MNHDCVVHLGLDIMASPVWTPGDDGLLGNVPVENLPISASLQGALMEWAKRYDSEVDEFGSISSTAKQELHDEGVEIWQRTVNEIGETWTVHLDSPALGESALVHTPSTAPPDRIGPP